MINEHDILDFSQFTQDSLRTESVIAKDKPVDRARLGAALRLAIASGQILDLFKKNVFYGKPINEQTLANLVDILDDNSEMLTHFFERFDYPLNMNPRLLHASIGAFTESTELLEALLPSYYDQAAQIDFINMKEETGDTMWYFAILIDEVQKLTAQNNATLSGSCERVIEKLKKRYPDKFTSEAAINRDLATERSVLEG